MITSENLARARMSAHCLSEKLCKIPLLKNSILSIEWQNILAYKKLSYYYYPQRGFSTKQHEYKRLTYQQSIPNPNSTLSSFSDTFPVSGVREDRGRKFRRKFRNFRQKQKFFSEDEKKCYSIRLWLGPPCDKLQWLESFEVLGGPNDSSEK